MPALFIICPFVRLFVYLFVHSFVHMLTHSIHPHWIFRSHSACVRVRVIYLLTLVSALNLDWFNATEHLPAEANDREKIYVPCMVHTTRKPHTNCYQIHQFGARKWIWAATTFVASITACYALCNMCGSHTTAEPPVFLEMCSIFCASEPEFLSLSLFFFIVRGFENNWNLKLLNETNINLQWK